MDLYRDKLNGSTNAELMRKYNLSFGRVQYLVKKERSKHEFRK